DGFFAPRRAAQFVDRAARCRYRTGRRSTMSHDERLWSRRDVLAAAAGAAAVGLGTDRLFAAGGPQVAIAADPDDAIIASAPLRIGDRTTLLACGNDARGLSYALTELADRVTHAEKPFDGLNVSEPIVEAPANAVRSVARLFASDVEDLPWFHDRTFWRDYLT